MEARFPQVCETCAPAVEDRIRSTGYAAKTDHLRRMMDRTRDSGVAYRSWSWKRAATLLGAIGWSIGFLGPLSWHIQGAFPLASAEDGLLEIEEPQSIPECLIYGAFKLQSTPFCNDLWQPLLPYTLGLSLLCCWWNPWMHYKLRGGYGRIVGHAEYYKLQLIALAMRFLSWKMMAKDSTLTIDPQARRALHAFNVTLGIIVSALIPISVTSFADVYPADVPVLPRYPNRSTAPCFVPGSLRTVDTRRSTARRQYNFSATLERS